MGCNIRQTLSIVGSCSMQAQNWYWYVIDILKIARIGILLTKSEWSELVLVFYWCPKVDNAQPCLAHRNMIQLFIENVFLFNRSKCNARRRKKFAPAKLFQENDFWSSLKVLLFCGRRWHFTIPHIEYHVALRLTLKNQVKDMFV